MWPGAGAALLPVALTPLWHETQVPVTNAWSIFCTGVQLTKLVWQASQVLPDVMWASDLPVVFVPSWQEKQLPAMPVWSKIVVFHVVVDLWQSSQTFEVFKWSGVLPLAGDR